MKPMLQIRDVGMVFATKRGPFCALRDINLDMQRGEFVSLIGHSGCGKSTLLNLVAGLTTPTTGVPSNSPVMASSPLKRGSTRMSRSRSRAANPTRPVIPISADAPFTVRSRV